ncbi:MAG TPA: sugar transferase [Paludibaculum sp.]
MSAGLRNSGALLVKRILDIVVATILLLPAIPFAVFIALAIVLDSPGSVLFAHPRIGKGNRAFRLFKFRTMVSDADTVLEAYLNAHPDLRSEWNETHKLKIDPRVTRVGRWLRRMSLDELPQLLSVLGGEMSMVGPRPIVVDEIQKYGPLFNLYLQAKPGLTGLWQASGRRDNSYQTRLTLDRRYLQERTLGMDLLVLLKTIRVVLLGHGAY